MAKCGEICFWKSHKFKVSALRVRDKSSIVPVSRAFNTLKNNNMSQYTKPLITPKIPLLNCFGICARSVFSTSLNVRRP